MAITSTILYNGELRTTATHVRSNDKIITDAPLDNKGKGEAFSPTDLVATSLASCMMTIMGIKARNLGLDISGAYAEIEKVMASGPRKISEIHAVVHMPEREFSSKDKSVLEHAARTCPVALSLHQDITQQIEFIWH